QEPGGNAQEILNGIRFVRPGDGFIPNFPLFKKIEVNGETEHPLYTFIKNKEKKLERSDHRCSSHLRVDFY
ncbi:hypothetical protein AVEN_222792-1, partial [Araneus ventricosus]